MRLKPISNNLSRPPGSREEWIMVPESRREFQRKNGHPPLGARQASLREANIARCYERRGISIRQSDTAVISRVEARRSPFRYESPKDGRPALLTDAIGNQHGISIVDARPPRTRSRKRAER
jgi:hypothetical protein